MHDHQRTGHKLQGAVENNGSKLALQDVVNFYVANSQLARARAACAMLRRNFRICRSTKAMSARWSPSCNR